MIEPLRSELVRLLLDGIEEDRKGNPNMNPTDVTRVIIQSFVEVQSQQDCKNRGIEVSCLLSQKIMSPYNVSDRRWKTRDALKKILLLLFYFI